tara:strand:- start:40 stop:1308 length:1269 start_codon:yes stop_codon:yes gene_type:complete
LINYIVNTVLRGVRQISVNLKKVVICEETPMDFKQQATAIFEKYITEWEPSPQRMESGYDYESTYAEMMQKVEKEVLQLSVGGVPRDKNVKKKLQTRFGQIELYKIHILAQSPTHMSISSYAQETMCYMGQHLVSKDAEEVVNNLTGAAINAKQIERICHHYGNSLEQEQLDNIEVKGYQEVLPQESEKCHYVSVDGSMYYTREGGWKEIKPGRIYKHEDLMETSKDRCELLSSDYVAHLGSSKDFLPKMEYGIENIKNKVFIADGATWIWNWVEDTYPECEQIVDFFHAKEHLCEFAKEYFKDKGHRGKWIDKQSEVMLNKGMSPVIKSLHKLPEKTDKLRQLIGYYTNHQKRMQYHLFKEKGFIIGSGAIESAHKDVLQKRLKLSGQRWTKKGLQQITQLRVIYKSKKWNQIERLCKKAA